MYVTGKINNNFQLLLELSKAFQLNLGSTEFQHKCNRITNLMDKMSYQWHQVDDGIIRKRYMQDACIVWSLRCRDSWTDYTLNVPQSVWSLRHPAWNCTSMRLSNFLDVAKLHTKTFDENSLIEIVEKISWSDLQGVPKITQKLAENVQLWNIKKEKNSWHHFL